MNARALSLAIAIALLGAAACRRSSQPTPTRSPPVTSALAKYLHDPAFRRAELERSLEFRDNDYARRRLDAYPKTWDRLTVFNPPVRALALAELGNAGPAQLATERLDISAAASAGDEAALLALGERAFRLYPTQLVDNFDVATRSRETAERYGLWLDDERGVGGLVHVVLPDGSTGQSYSCSTCHMRRASDGKLTVGLANTALDVGRVTFDHLRERNRDPSPELLAWGPGRADVTNPDATHPVRIPDLRATRHLRHLQHNATVVQTSVIALAIRLETLIIGAHGEAIRPPREIALGLALYLWSLAPTLPAVEPTLPSAPEHEHARALFAERCAGCHQPPSFTGAPVPLERIGDDIIGRSSYRGTGTWRVPTLLGVATRGPLLHDGSVADVAKLLDPARGPAAPHRFGYDLAAADRVALTRYLESL